MSGIKRWIYALVGAVVVVGVLGLVVGRQPLKAISYFGNQPQLCLTCHLMTPWYRGWENSPHDRVATCNDCHVPQTPVISVLFKAKQATRQGYAYYIGTVPEAIKINRSSQEVVHRNCLRCHAALVEQYVGDTRKFGGRYCFDCHRSTPHGDTLPPEQPVPGSIATVKAELGGQD